MKTRHHVNSALFYLAINKEPWIKQSDKARMLEWKIRMDLLQYVARGCPGISLDAIATYVPKTGDSSNTTVRGEGYKATSARHSARHIPYRA